jgi:DNA-binding NarL/FixJ family response regulator
MASASPVPTGPTVGSLGSIVLVEDDTLLRDLLARVIQQRFAPRELRTFGDGAAGLAHCLATPPDLLVTDLRLPGVEGRDIIRRLRAKQVATRFVVLTSHVSPTLPAELIALGVAGFIDKTSPLEHTERAIERVLAGGLYFSANVSPSPFPHLGSSEGQGPAPGTLSDREREIVRLVASGLFSKEIGDKLGISPRTVEKERVQIMEKLGVRDLPGLIRWCVRNGLV